MDKNDDCIIPHCGILPDLRKDRLVVGSKQLKKALLQGRARCVFLARDADPAVTEPIARLCEEAQVEARWVPAMATLGRACGIDVGAAAAATLKTGSNGDHP